MADLHPIYYMVLDMPLKWAAEGRATRPGAKSVRLDSRPDAGRTLDLCPTRRKGTRRGRGFTSPGLEGNDALSRSPRNLG